MDPTLPILPVLGYWAFILVSFGGSGWSLPGHLEPLGDRPKGSMMVLNPKVPCRYVYIYICIYMYIYIYAYIYICIYIYGHQRDGMVLPLRPMYVPYGYFWILWVAGTLELVRGAHHARRVPEP